MSLMNYIAILPLQPRKRTFPSSQKAHLCLFAVSSPLRPHKGNQCSDSYHRGLVLSVLELHVVESQSMYSASGYFGPTCFWASVCIRSLFFFFFNWLSFHYLNIMCMSIHLLRTVGLSFGSLDKAAMHILVLAFLETSVFSSLGKCPGVELLGWRVGIRLTWWDWFPKWLYFMLSVILTLAILMCVVLFHYGINLRFWWPIMLSTVPCDKWLFVYLL